MFQISTFPSFLRLEVWLGRTYPIEGLMKITNSQSRKKLYSYIYIYILIELEHVY
jgi:hypothetical protein